MKRFFTLIFAIGMVGILSAQDEHEMIIESTGVGILEQTIFGDTMPTGERVDPDRVYVLRRGTPYLLGEIVDVADFHLRLKAEGGDGNKPILILNVGDGVNAVDQMFVASSGGHITLEGLHLAGQDIFGINTNRIIRINGDKSRVSVNDCILDYSGQSGFRLNADSIKVFVSNTIIDRMGQLNDPNNGRFLDNRGHPIDSLWVTNCIIYDITSRIYRHGGDAAYLHHAKIDQCTFFGSGQWGFTFSPSDELTFTNNIVANPVFLGYSGEQRYAMTIDTFRDGDQIDISYNNFFTSPAFDEALPETASGSDISMDGDTVYSVNGDYFGPQISNAMAASASSTTNFSEVLEFANAPEIQQDFIDNTYDSTATLGVWDFSDLTPDPDYSLVGGATAVDRYTTFHDFSYPESAQSFTAGTSGQKIGADLSNLGTDVKEDFFVRDNILFYPNPVRSELFIQNLDEADLHSIMIYDLKGVPVREQKVRASNAVLQLPDVPSGTYILTIRDKAGKVSSRKLIKN
ncbi:MAG: T9SS type A sorting domain-containing protein [Saprospiraceae bacterium]|nr:T9SS type A sorting domain-containing protein [Saprospiraceae bacterium]